MWWSCACISDLFLEKERKRLGWRSRGMKTFRFADTAFFNTNRTNQNKHSSRWAMHGMCCHFPNTIRSWSNTLNCLKALEYKVRKDYCVNNNNNKKEKKETKPQQTNNKTNPQDARWFDSPLWAFQVSGRGSLEMRTLIKSFLESLPTL